MEYKYVVQFCKLGNFIHLTLTLILLVLKLNLDIVKIYVHIENNVRSFKSPKVEP